MPTLKECHLKFPLASEQIPYPRNFVGSKSGAPDDEEFFVGKQPRYLTSDEVEVANAFMAKLPYKQSLVLTGSVLVDQNDPLFEKSHAELDEIERDMNLPNSRPQDGECSVRERVYRIREQLPDHVLDGKKALTGGAGSLPEVLLPSAMPPPSPPATATPPPATATSPPATTQTTA